MNFNTLECNDSESRKFVVELVHKKSFIEKTKNGF